MNNKYINNAKLLTLIAEIINASEDASEIIENSAAYQNRNDEHHADAVNDYNALTSIYNKAVEIESSIIS